MGRKPIPTKLHVLRGNPSKIPDLDKKAKKEPKPKDTSTTAAAWLRKDKIALAEWKRVVIELSVLGLLTKLDRTALEAYCKCWSNYRKCQAVIDKDGCTITHINKFGAENVVARPEVAMAQKWVAQAKSYISDFGLSPSARSRMEVPGKPDELDPMEALLG